MDRVMAILASAYQCGVLFGAVACLYLLPLISLLWDFGRMPFFFFFSPSEFSPLCCTSVPCVCACACVLVRVCMRICACRHAYLRRCIF